MVTAAVLFLAASGVLMRNAVQALVPMSDNQASGVVGVLTFIIGFVGYELIHRLGDSRGCSAAHSRVNPLPQGPRQL